MKYPKEIFIDRTRQTFYVTDELSPVSEKDMKDGKSPLDIYSGFARFTFNIINEGKKAAKANLPVENAADIIERSKACYARNMFEKPSETAPAYKVTMTSGIHKGKTPAQVLLQDQDQVETLKNQWKFLNQNLTRYPKNKEQMNAIADAIQLLKNGKLSGSQSDQIVIFDTKGPRPLIHKTDQNGFCPVNEMSVIWRFGEEKPVVVSIRSYRAPFIRKENGTINVVGKKAKDLISNTFYVTDVKWNWLIRKMELSMRLFESKYGPKLYNRAEEEQRRNIASSVPVQKKMNLTLLSEAQANNNGTLFLSCRRGDNGNQVWIALNNNVIPQWNVGTTANVLIQERDGMLIFNGFV